MPKELKEESNLALAIDQYRKSTGTEPYQPLSSLINKILCQLNSSQSVEIPSPYVSLISMEYNPIMLVQHLNIRAKL